MAENEFFWSDPKVWISILALALAAINFIYTVSVQSDQNRRWDKINDARVELMDVGFIKFREITKEKAQETVWGYEPIIFHKSENKTYTENYFLPYALKWVRLNGAGYEPIRDSNYFFTLLEGAAEMSRMGLQQQGNEIFKHFEIQFDFKNFGKTTAKYVAVQIKEVKNTKFKERIAFSQEAPMKELPAEGTFNANLGIGLPLNSSLPLLIHFEIHIAYENIQGKKIQKMIPVTYQSDRNYWVYDNL